MNFRNTVRNTRNFSLDLSEVNEQSDDELSNRFYERKSNVSSKRNSITSFSTEGDKKKFPKLNNSVINERKVKFSSACEDTDSNEDHKEVQNSNDGSDSQYESQDSSGSLKVIRQRKNLPQENIKRKISDTNEKNIDTIEVITDDIDSPRKLSVVGRNRRDSRVQIFEDPDSGVKF